jgi:hypothetical protein
VDRGTIGKIDDADWGYWVKLDYGMYNNNYLWRAPYFDWDVSKDGSTSQFRKGFKQTYYLNTIRTRSHTALFAKSLKNDGKSFFESDGDGREDPLNVNEPTDPTPAAVSHSLKLDDVYILKNEDYDYVKNNFITKWNFNYNNATNWAWAWNVNTNPPVFQIDNIDANMLLSSDISTNSSVISYLNTNQQQKIHFNYSDALCKGTFNSWIGTGGCTGFASISQYTDYSYHPERLGKLTLESVDVLGKNNTRFTPNYVFDYDAGNASANPIYHPYKKDDQGLYKRCDGCVQFFDGPHNPEPGGDQWSLKKVTTPLGAVMQIEYERDTYSNLNGLGWGWIPLKIPGYNVAANIMANRIYVDTRFGDLNKFMIVGTAGFIRAPVFSGWGQEQFFNFTISAIDPNGTYFDFTSPSSVGFSIMRSLISINPFADASLIGAVTGADNNPKYGGELRVKALTTTDEFGNKYVTRYNYNNSGVATYEPSSNQTYNPGYDRSFEHPISPIIYGNVKVSNGRMNGATFEPNSSTTYKYTTPHYNMLNIDKGATEPNTNLLTNINVTNTNNDYGAYYATYNNGTKNVPGKEFRARSGHIIITDNTSQIGNIEEVTTYNGRDEGISQTTYEYGMGANNMGVYGETNFLFEYFNEPTITNVFTTRLFQTTKIKNNMCLKSVTNNIGGVVSKMEVQNWDYKTGKPTQVLNTVGSPNGYGEAYLNEYFPAYEKYPEMGSKVRSYLNKNIMTQNVQEKNWVNSNASFKLLSSKVTTWANTINYRLFDQPSGKYVSQPMVWSVGFIPPYHPHKEYVWKSGVDLDGTIKASDYVEFNWLSGTQDPRWIKTSEATLYSNYSKLLEGLDVNNKKISVKYTHNQSYPIAMLNNVGYGEWCFSSAEDVSTGNESNYFGGEVSETQYRFNDGINNVGLAHTGKYSLQVPSAGGLGFHFRGSFGATGDFKPNKTYRAAVWLHQSNLNGALYCEGQSSSGIFPLNTISIAPGSIKEKYGDWYLLNLDITLPAASAIPGTNPVIVFGCYNSDPTSGTFVYFDDFRVQPLGAAFEASVFDDKTGNLLAKLDAENIATRFYYDDVNKLIKTEKETKNGFVLISKSSYNYKR